MNRNIVDRIAMYINSRIEVLDKTFSDPIVILTRDNFDKVISMHRVVVVDFTTEWCNPCKAYLPVFRRVARKFLAKERENIVFAIIDTDRESEIADRYHVENIPTTLIFVDGHVVDVIVGVVTEQKLIDKLENILVEIRQRR